VPDGVGSRSSLAEAPTTEPADGAAGAEAEPAEEVAPVDEAVEALLARVSEPLGDAVVAHETGPGRTLWVRVTTEAWADAGRIAKDRADLRYFDFLSAIDWMPSPYCRYEDDDDVDPDKPWPPPMPTADDIRPGTTGGDTRFQVLACVARPHTDLRLLLKADVPDDNLVVPTWIGNYAGAAWHEREVHEMFGIGFDGNPDLRNIYLPGGFEGHPLRKDFPLLSRVVKPWPGIVDVEPMPGSDDEGEEVT
jgi:NADH-quinone oxidoreductase subunit C